MKTITKQIPEVDALIFTIQKNRSTQTEVTKLYELLFPFIISQIRKHRFLIINVESQELANDLFTKIYFQLDKFVPSRGSIYSWVKTITRNALTDLYRKQKAERCQSLDLMLENGFKSEINTDYFTPEALLVNRELGSRINRVLEKLNGINKELFFGFYFENKSVNELAIKNAITCNAVSVRLNRIRTSLKNEFVKAGIKVDNP